MSFTYPSEQSCQARYLHLYIARFSKRPIFRGGLFLLLIHLYGCSSGLHPTYSQLLPHPRCRRDVFFLEQRFGFAYRPDHDVVQNCYVVVSQEESSQYFASPCPLAIEGCGSKSHCNSSYGNVCREFDSPKDRLSFPQHSRCVPPLLP